MATDFKQILQSLDLHEIDKLRQAKQAITYLQGRKQQLQQEMVTIDEQITAVTDGTIDPASVIPQSAKTSRPAGTQAISRRRATAGSLTNKIIDVLKDKPDGLKVSQITEAVLATGYQTTAKNFGVIVGIKAGRMAELERVTHGVYRLKPA